MVLVCKNLDVFKNFEWQRYSLYKIGVIKVKIVNPQKFIDMNGFVALNSKKKSATNNLKVVSSNPIGYTPVTEKCGIAFVRAKKLDEYGEPDFDDQETKRLPYIIEYPEMEQQLEQIGLSRI
jgi:hypothetical protein